MKLGRKDESVDDDRDSAYLDLLETSLGQPLLGGMHRVERFHRQQTEDPAPKMAVRTRGRSTEEGDEVMGGFGRRLHGVGRGMMSGTVSVIPQAWPRELPDNMNGLVMARKVGIPRHWTHRAHECKQAGEMETCFRPSRSILSQSDA